MTFSRKTFAFILGLALILAISLSAYSRTDAQTTQDQVDQLLADYQKALEYELEHGQTVEVTDPDTGKTRELTGESLAKLEALWEETQRQINELVARPEEERAKVVQLIQSVEPVEVVYSHQTRLPFYDLDAKVEVYTTAENRYTVDIETGQIIEIIPLHILYGERKEGNTKSQIYSQADLEVKAREIITLVTGGLELDKLTPNFSSKSNGKDQNFFFRWEDLMALDYQTPGVMPPFIQIGLSNDGSLLNFINTIPFASGTSSETIEETEAAFSEVYANDGGFWSGLTGNATEVDDYEGWCYINHSSYPTLCGLSFSPLWTFRYQQEKSTPDKTGNWLPNSNSNVYAYAFIPWNNATAYAQYRVYRTGLSYVEFTINQYNFSNAWATISASPQPNINKIRLQNKGDSCCVVAWDEVWVYKP